MKKLKIEEVEYLKSPIDAYWSLDKKSISVIKDKPYRYDYRRGVIDKLENDVIPFGFEDPFIRGLDTANCAFLNFSAQWIPCTEEGEEVLIISE
ncbi:hypothetical protein QT327_21345 [Olivibacter sp. 47]|uniref:hypothetical protein n=1 Tax=Olivibacter sp. 47 TaxID=3056486 RepID=UPI0025A4B838|nr:hypothetical protein [Olivibacter sp. 47]MDM8176862.1 hypothetical protein [Olivibacter sp. 47]